MCLYRYQGKYLRRARRSAASRTTRERHLSPAERRNAAGSCRVIDNAKVHARLSASRLKRRTFLDFEMTSASSTGRSLFSANSTWTIGRRNSLNLTLLMILKKFTSKFEKSMRWSISGLRIMQFRSLLLAKLLLKSTKILTSRTSFLTEFWTFTWFTW